MKKKCTEWGLNSNDVVDSAAARACDAVMNEMTNSRMNEPVREWLLHRRHSSIAEYPLQDWSTWTNDVSPIQIET